MSTMETQIQDWNGESVIVRKDAPTGSWIFIAVHSSTLGAATGGTRMRQYSDHTTALHDALRLAEGMTRKFAVAGFPRGGGKAVISIPEELSPDARTDLLLRYGGIIGQLGGYFYTGPDVGTTSEDMDLIARHGAPYVHSCTPACGGAGSSGAATALGVFTGIQVMCKHLFGDDSLRQRRVLVQGAGSVGTALIEHLRQAGADVIVSEIDQQVVRQLKTQPELRFVPTEKALETECDILAPCAMGGLFSAQTIPNLRCRAIVGGANNQLATTEDAIRLKQRGIAYAPDYVVNFGGAMAITGIEALGWTNDEANRQVVRTVRTALSQVLSIAEESGVSTEAAAAQLAKQRLNKHDKEQAGVVTS
ncbi:MAG: hypothetical protein OEV49_10750 [candidate division Zixibacteria bacterium]|nr:hypothetical protein [candidate division Zixibacteria bacterium]MDH3939216.1 hypothetical protein [candidate division Zixibacteria bacterium]MDH4034250.1 hypothetical protein [candidate division Zixibacteria bacterium]